MGSTYRQQQHCTMLCNPNGISLGVFIGDKTAVGIGWALKEPNVLRTSNFSIILTVRQLSKNNIFCIFDYMTMFFINVS